ncbi:hypothetical protein [Cryobacterium sp. GrIS_2_6]|uniref:hypothetical protein n=1 Tax=Cryobacterium sp. GrIS_2_6 TaxID=3162785 RepID=UPI002E01DA26|nr:hypothetical protein [Cryobacterium psychrotolerans]
MFSSSLERSRGEKRNSPAQLAQTDFPNHPTTPNPRTFNIFRITTSADETVTFLRSRTSAHSEVAIGEGAPQRAAVGCNFEIGESAVVQWADGGGWTGGLVVDVVQIVQIVEIVEIVEIDSDNVPRM